MTKSASTKRFGLALLAASSLFIAALDDGTTQSLVGTQWSVATLNGQPFAEGAGTFTLTFEGRVHAWAGCNGMGGSYKLADHTLDISRMMATEMACMPEQKMKDEAALEQALSQGPFKVTQAGNDVTLTGKNATVITLKPSDSGEGGEKGDVGGEAE